MTIYSPKTAVASSATPKPSRKFSGVRPDAPDWANMWDMLDALDGRVPQWLLPVAMDEYGNIFAVSLRADDFGSVWFWDHEEEADEDEPPTEDNIQFKTSGWNAFLASLQPAQA